MVDVTLPQLGSPSRWHVTPALLIWVCKRLLAVLLAVVLSVAAVEAIQRQCDSRLGKLMVRLKLDAYYPNCRCMTHSLDLSDACNSMYIGIGIL
jgi:hypothetical protein